MTTPVNGTIAPRIQADTSIALLYCELSQHVLLGMVAQLQSALGGSERALDLARFFTNLAQRISEKGERIKEEAARALVIAQPGDVPKVKLT